MVRGLAPAIAGQSPTTGPLWIATSTRRSRGGLMIAAEHRAGALDARAGACSPADPSNARAIMAPGH
jgi:hypothetical protein